MASREGMVANVILVGTGRMGSLVRQGLEASGGFEVVGAYDVKTVGQLDAEAPAADVVVDFSAPGALPHVAAYVTRTSAALVSGVTGYGEADMACLRELGTRAAVVHSPNYSMGVAVLRRLVAQAAAALPGFDVEIVETHHNQKADAPSGTAKALLAAVDPTGECPVTYGRQGFLGPRPAREVGVHALRGGTVAGTHEVHLFGPDEELCLTHRATSRQVFAQGAVEAARRMVSLGTGFYTFDQVMFGE